MHKTVITISGPSGVGKTTLASLITFLYSGKTSTIISGDSFHRWSRKNKRWKKLTHLNPYANNLKKAFQVISKLKFGKDVFLKKYNHSTGKFDKPELQPSNDIIIYEGLHALYGQEILSISDLKIYVDTPVELTKEWKVARDVSSRGYSVESVEKELARRKNDQKKYIEIQKKNADVIVAFKKNELNKIGIQITKGSLPLLEETFEAFNDFLILAKELSSDISLTHGAGGNFSVKIRNQNLFFVKSSGSHIPNVDAGHGFVLCDKANIETVVQGFGRPSMETGFHANLKHRVVVHSHPVYLNAILCSKESREIINKLFSNYIYIPYVTPGYKLCKRIKDVKQSIIFLENHGIITTSDDIQDCISLVKNINHICQEWLKKNRIDIINYPTFNSEPLFPDAVIFPQEIKIVNDFILSLMAHSGLHPRFLTNKQQKELLSLDAEKYRKKQ